MTSNEKGVGDTAYQTFSNMITPLPKLPNREHLPWEKAFNHLVSSVRAIGDCVNSRLKQHNILSKPWRHDFVFHQEMFETFANFVNVNIKFHPLAKTNNPLLFL